VWRQSPFPFWLEGGRRLPGNEEAMGAMLRGEAKQWE